jgi:protein TonB
MELYAMVNRGDASAKYDGPLLPGDVPAAHTGEASRVVLHPAESRPKAKSIIATANTEIVLPRAPQPTSVVRFPGPSRKADAVAPPPLLPEPPEFTQQVHLEAPRQNAPIARPSPPPAPRVVATVEPLGAPSGSIVRRLAGRLPIIRRRNRNNSDDEFRPARVTQQPLPALPRLMATFDNEATVEMLLDVDRSGRVAGVESEGGDNQLADAAAEAVFRWTFIPAQRNGIAVPSRVRVHFVFRNPSRQAEGL